MSDIVCRKPVENINNQMINNCAANYMIVEVNMWSIVWNQVKILVLKTKFWEFVKAKALIYSQSFQWASTALFCP